MYEDDAPALQNMCRRKSDCTHTWKGRMMQRRLLFTKASRRLLVMVGVLTLLAFAGAQVLPVSAAGADNMAFVRVVHASPDAGTVDVFVDGAKLLSNFQFATVTNYVSVPAGAHKIQVAPAGKGMSAAVITQTVSVNAGVPYTVAALGTKASGFSLTAFADNNLISGGMAKVRVYHLSPDAGPVNVAVGGNTVISALTYQNASGYLTVPPGSYTFNVTATQVNATVPVAATLSANMITSVFAVGLLNGSPKLQFVAAQVAGVPGMPGTGSDPNPVTSNTQPLDLLLIGLLALGLVGTGAATRKVVVARQKVR